MKDVTLGFGYNAAGQVASVTRSNDAYAWGQGYNVDRPYGVNGLNQLTSAGGTALGYDARGNLTSSGGSVFGYSSENLLVSAPGGVTLGYDPLLRLTRTAGASVTRFGYDGQDLIAEYDALGNLARRYVHGAGSDEPVVWYEGSGTNDRAWLHADERGSVVAVSGNTGTAQLTNSYDEFGIPGSGNSGRFQYTGQTWLPEAGLYYYKARMYSPTLGRFMQTDPIGYGDGVNWYNYVGGDPVNKVDPSGLEEDGPPIVVTGSCPSDAYPYQGHCVKKVKLVNGNSTVTAVQALCPPGYVQMGYTLGCRLLQVSSPPRPTAAPRPSDDSVVNKVIKRYCPRAAKISWAGVFKSGALGVLGGVYKGARYAGHYFATGAVRGGIAGGAAGTFIGGIGAVPGAIIGSVEGGVQGVVFGIGKDAAVGGGSAAAGRLYTECNLGT